MDDSYRTQLVQTHEARDAIDALLAQREVAVKHSGVFGCSTKWKEKQAARLEAVRKIESLPVQLELASAADLKALRTNPTHKVLLVSFWATWCGSCIPEYSDFYETFRVYRASD